MEDCSQNIPPDCCDMRGMLSFMMLWLLLKRDMYGQELAEEMGRRRGSKPNPGTLYPALSDLVGKGLIVARHEGRRKVYTLTDEGRRGAEEACEYFCRAYGDIFQEFQLKVAT
jgi:PadR family transcriptional regulator PadR